MTVSKYKPRAANNSTKLSVVAILIHTSEHIPTGVNHIIHTTAIIQQRRIALLKFKTVSRSTAFTLGLRNNIPMPKKKTITPKMVKSLMAVTMFEGTAL